jgi:enoyl-[acyl-carrier protein] reductase I
MGVCKVALQATMRYVARDLGSHGVRANLVAAGPLHTRAAGGIPDFQTLLDAYEAAPLGWDCSDAGPVADAVCFLLSDMGRAISGEVLHVDGGYHALAAPGVRSRVKG